MPPALATPGIDTNGNPVAKSGATIVPQPDRNYFKAPNESIDAYNSRVASYNAGKASEPAVVSSENAQQRIDEAKARIADMAKKGTTVDESGREYYADGSAVPPPAGMILNEKTGQYEAAAVPDYGAAAFYGDSQTAPDSDYAAIERLFDPLKRSLDASTLSQVSAIHQQFDALKEMQKEANRRADQSRARTLSLGGTSRYSPFTASGIQLAQTSFGLQRLQDLDAKENAAIADAQQAQQKGDTDLMLKSLDMAESIRSEKQKSAKDVMDKISAMNEKLRTQAIQASRDSAIAGLMSQGVTDPAKILDMLNKYEDGSSTGGDFTAQEVADAIKRLTPETKKSTDLYKFSTDDVGKLLATGMHADTIQALQDYYNGHGDAPTISDKQTAIVQQILSSTKPKAAGSEVPVESIPTFDDFLGDWIAEKNLPLPMLTEQQIEKARSEYDAKYPGQTLSLGKLTPTNKNDLTQAGLAQAPAAVQSYFINAPAAFRDEYQRSVANGTAKKSPTIDDLDALYSDWYARQKNKSSSDDWSALLGG